MNHLKVDADNTLQEIDATRYPMLSAIDSPDDLRKLPIDRLPAVCTDIRNFLIESLSHNPGHFASSMGSVELTVALHYVFNTPYDRIVWDVGHQAYGHKLLTGRAKRFHTNRKLGGIAPFTNPAESDYDSFIAGHASNSISAALGMAVSTSLNTDDPKRNVVAVIGDASIAGGLAFEGLNNAANTNSDILIILNDNDMSIDYNVGSLNGYLASITTSRSYNNLRFYAFNTLKKYNLLNDKSRGRILRFNNSVKSLITHEQNIFEGLNIRYFGPFDGHDLPRLVSVLSAIKDMKGPRLLHLRTIKGKGYSPAEHDPARWHAPGKFDPESGKVIASNPSGTPKYQDIFGATLVELAEHNPKIVAVTAAMPSGTSVNMMEKQFPTRTFDVGISEGHAVTFAGGMAKDGLLPYVAIYSSFLQRAYDHIIHDVALMELPVTFCIDRAGIVGEDGATHHGTFDLSYMSSIPGMTVCSPRNSTALRNLLYTSQLPSRRGPMAIRYPRGAAHIDDGNPATPFVEIPIGKGECLSNHDINRCRAAVLALGPINHEVANAVDQLAKQGIEVAHFDMVFLKPIDTDILSTIARSGLPIITVEDAAVKGGLGSAVIEWLADNGYTNPVYRIGIPDKFVPHGSVKQLHKLCGLDQESIINTINKAIAQQSR